MLRMLAAGAVRGVAVLFFGVYAGCLGDKHLLRVA